MEKLKPDLIQNFVNQWRKPFSVEVCSAMTGVSKSKVKRELKRYIQEGRVKEPETGIYIVNHNITHSGDANGNKWNYNTDSGLEILKSIDGKGLKGVRDVATTIQKSRQYAFLYMEALASIDCLGLNTNGYFVKSYDGLSRLGTVVKKGILSEMRIAAGLPKAGRVR